MHRPENSPCILIAEDDPDDQLMIQEAFEDNFSECQLRFVQNGVELIQFLLSELKAPETGAKFLPDLILLDLNMPLKDGRQALLEIESEPRFQQIPVAVLTTSSDAEDADFCRAHGARYFLSKPTTYSELARMVVALKQQWPKCLDTTRKEHRCP